MFDKLVKFCLQRLKAIYVIGIHDIEVVGEIIFFKALQLTINYPEESVI